MTIKIPVINKKTEIKTGKSLRPDKIIPNKTSAVKQIKVPTEDINFADFLFISATIIRILS